MVVAAVLVAVVVLAVVMVVMVVSAGCCLHGGPSTEEVQYSTYNLLSTSVFFSEQQGFATLLAALVFYELSNFPLAEL